jgi:hypothetical protein
MRLDRRAVMWVLVVLIVDMSVLVFERFVRMRMLVALIQMQP